MLEASAGLTVVSKCNLYVADLNGEVYQVRVTKLFLRSFYRV